MIDVSHQMNRTRRNVGGRVLEAGEAHVVTIGQTYPTDAEDLWDALTNPERIPRWFLPISGDLEVGGRYQLEGNAGGTVLSCDPPREFTATWEFNGAISWIEVRVFDDGAERSRFELAHIARADDPIWQQYGPGAVGIGWELGMCGLTIHLSTGERVDPAAFEQWSMGEDGRTFVTEAAEGWHRAAVDGGLDPQWARAAADRCRGFYLGESQN
ncbi:SRPBCC family protein [Mycolicibacterium brisbanense]|nr:SRPBCC family protein [Mycolicibacterium brisbanense]MCV7158364.1 SRPBCC family protein [Mycolicibacterium brisbanense]